MGTGCCLWFTGLSASGKTTLARLLEKALVERGLKVEVLDGDIVRSNLSKGLGFSREDRETNLRRIAFVSKLLVRNGVVVIVATISPYRNIRDEIRTSMPNFVEVYVNCPLEVCIQRDPKGLYEKALAGEIPRFTGVNDAFDPPFNPEVEIRTDTETPEEGAVRILRALEMLRYVPLVDESAFSEQEQLLVEKRLKDLGYM
jgi:adenylyl-sulfate kinase